MKVSQASRIIAHIEVPRKNKDVRVSAVGLDARLVEPARKTQSLKDPEFVCERAVFINRPPSSERCVPIRELAEALARALRDSGTPFLALR